MMQITQQQKNGLFSSKFPEGIQLIQQIYFTHNSPTRMYNRFIKQIDETASAIDEFYK